MVLGPLEGTVGKCGRELTVCETEGLGGTQLTAGDDMLRRHWMRITGQVNEVDIVVRVYYKIYNAYILS